jgi:hypothetical protein
MISLTLAGIVLATLVRTLIDPSDVVVTTILMLGQRVRKCGEERVPARSSQGFPTTKYKVLRVSLQ